MGKIVIYTLNRLEFKRFSLNPFGIDRYFYLPKIDALFEQKTFFVSKRTIKSGRFELNTKSPLEYLPKPQKEHIRERLKQAAKDNEFSSKVLENGFEIFEGTIKARNEVSHYMKELGKLPLEVKEAFGMTEVGTIFKQIVTLKDVPTEMYNTLEKNAMKHEKGLELVKEAKEEAETFAEGFKSNKKEVRTHISGLLKSKS